MPLVGAELNSIIFLYIDTNELEQLGKKTYTFDIKKNVKMYNNSTYKKKI